MALPADPHLRARGRPAAGLALGQGAAACLLLGLLAAGAGTALAQADLAASAGASGPVAEAVATGPADVSAPAASAAASQAEGLPVTAPPQPAPPPPPPPPVGLTHQVDEPRAYGHLVGDVVTRRIHLQLPAGLRLRGDSLPVPGRRGQAIELRAVEHQGPHTAARQTLVLRYQLFAAPLQPRVLELPPVLLDFEPVAGGRVQTLRIDAWPLQVAALGPAEASRRRGLDDLQPDALAPALDTRAARLRLGLWLTGLAGVLGGLAWVLLLRPYLLRRRQPFARLRRELAALPAQALAVDARAVFARLHAALREQAGRNLLARDLPDYLRARPGLAPLAAELHAFHAASETLFFLPQAGPAEGWDLARLRRLAEGLAAVEKLAPESLAGAGEGA